ncbi:MAG: glycosyltransferase family 39 protein, partial [Eubacteriales bacterium]|nr:glycosyltransferase family 39 protein [Eubacteriales bacterium]
MRKLLTILLFVCLLSVPALALAENADQITGDELLYNGDFSLQAESAPLPAGWELSAYQNDAAGVSASVASEDGTDQIVLTNNVANDSRVTQEVDVFPNTIYRLSAEIRTSDVQYGTGANLSIDNYPIDGTFCYSENLFGSDAWRSVSLYFRTGAEQTKVCVALRLGGYGTTAVGTAEFRNVSMVECVSTDAEIVNLATENGTVSSQTDASTAEVAKKTANDPLYLAIAFTLVLAVAIVWFYRYKLRYASRTLETVERPRLILMAILLGAFALRVVLSIIFYGHPTDINCFMAWGNMVVELKPYNFYTSGAFADYPPGYMYICGAIAGLCKLLGIPYGSDGMALLFKMPSTIADLLTAYLLYRLAKNQKLGEKSALILAGIYAFTPTLMFVSGAWGQIDSALALLIALVILLLQKDKRILAGAVYGLAILMKPQALMFGPILAVAFVLDIIDDREQWAKKLWQTALAVAAALAVIFALALPFQGSQGPLWLIEKYSSTATSYHYVSIEAFNFGSLFGWNWKTADTLILWMPYYKFGMGMIILSVLFSSALYYFGRKKSHGALFLSAGLAVLLIFTFGHYMHERYMLPALLLILIAYLYYGDRRLLAVFGGLTITSFLNATCAYYVVNHQDARGTVYNVITFIGSLATVLLAIYLSFVAFQILVKGKIPEPLLQEKMPQKKLPRRISLLPGEPTDNKLHYSKRDILFVLGITLVYGVVALTNLGSTKAPQTYWYSNQAGESITVKFNAVEHVSAYSIYGNIDNDGTLLISTPDGHEETFSQKYDDMFRWKKVTTEFVTDTVTLSLYSGSLKLNEIAFYDLAGEQIPLTIIGARGTQGNLADEQDTVAEPSYYTGMYFDELYHARTAYENLHNLTPYENSHPPLGKLLIMLGVWAFGMTPFGWRVVGALFGICMLPVLYAFGKRLFKNSNYALVLTTLFAFDFMHFTQTRIATIDVYSVFFILLMYYYMYQYITMNFFV